MGVSSSGASFPLVANKLRHNELTVLTHFGAGGNSVEMTRLSETVVSLRDSQLVSATAGSVAMVRRGWLGQWRAVYAARLRATKLRTVPDSRSTATDQPE